MITNFNKVHCIYFLTVKFYRNKFSFPKLIFHTIHLLLIFSQTVCNLQVQDRGRRRYSVPTPLISPTTTVLAHSLSTWTRNSPVRRRWWGRRRRSQRTSRNSTNLVRTGSTIGQSGLLCGLCIVFKCCSVHGCKRSWKASWQAWCDFLLVLPFSI